MSAKLTHCPPRTALSDFALGKVDEAGIGIIGAHIAICQDCRQFVSDFADDNFLELIRRAHAPARDPAVPKPSASATHSFPPDELITNSTFSSDTLPHHSNAGLPDQSSCDTSVDLSIPSLLVDHPDYEVISELGRGGMAVVYLARNRLMDRLEVLKIVNKTLLNRAGSRERFQQEIRAAARLSHPNIVTAYSAVRLGDLLAFAMEYIDGRDLSKIVKQQGPLPVADATAYAQQVAYGLQHALEKKMVHRDIKPANLILATGGKSPVVKILDFGLAKATSEKVVDDGLTASGQVLGTPDYLAPEQIQNPQQADIRADIYSLGCTLYFLLTGVRPFTANNVYEILQSHRTRLARPVNEVRTTVPASLAVVVAKMMAKDPANRYQTPVEVAQALDVFTVPPGTTESNRAASAPNQVAPPMPLSVSNRAGAAISAPAPIARRAASSAIVPSFDSPPPLKGIPPAPAPRTERTLAARLRIPVGILAPLLAAMAGLCIAVGYRAIGGKGTIVVEVSEPHVNIAVDGVPIAAAWADDGRKAEISLPSGGHQIEIMKEGFVSFLENVRVDRGRSKFLTADLKPLDKLTPAVTDEPVELNSQPTGEETAAPAGDSALNIPQVAPAPFAAPVPSAAAVPGQASVGSPLNRKATIVGDGSWSIQSDQLVQDDAESSALLLFGSPAWTDYDLSVEVFIDRGLRGIEISYRVSDDDNRRAIRTGGFGGTWYEAGHYRDAEWSRSVPVMPRTIEAGRWYQVKVEVRGDLVHCLLDNQELFNFRDTLVSSGRVGLGTQNTAARFRNIRVTAPDGKNLWAGLPMIDRSNAVGPKNLEVAGEKRVPDWAMPVPISGATQKDLIGARLNNAKATYNQKIKAYCGAVDRFFADRAEIIRKNGAATVQLAQLQSDRVTFAERGVLPPTASSELSERGMLARAALCAAYKMGSEQYNEAGKTKQAELIDKEFDEFWATSLPKSWVENILTNAGFEQAIDQGGLSGWVVDGPWSSAGINPAPKEGKLLLMGRTAVRTKGQALALTTCSFTQSVEIRLLQSVRKASGPLVFEFQGYARAAKGRCSISVGFPSRSRSSQRATICRAFTRNGKWEGLTDSKGTQSDPPVGADGWFLIQGSAAAPANAQRIDVNVRVYDDSTVYFDGFSLKLVTR